MILHMPAGFRSGKKQPDSRQAKGVHFISSTNAHQVRWTGGSSRQLSLKGAPAPRASQATSGSESACMLHTSARHAAAVTEADPAQWAPCRQHRVASGRHSSNERCPADSAPCRAPPCGNLAGHGGLRLHQPPHDVLLESLVPLCPDAPVGKPAGSPTWQQGVIRCPCHHLEALQQGLLCDFLRQGRVVQDGAITVCRSSGADMCFTLGFL